jgi:putative solute:sodium symporter small subunit
MAHYETAGAAPAGPPAARSEGYWRANVRLQFGLLVVWAVVGYVLSIFLAGPLNSVTVYGFPIAFWVAQQGAIVVFVILIFVYAWQMDRLDEEYDVHEGAAGEVRRRAEARMQQQLTGETPYGDGEER